MKILLALHNDSGSDSKTRNVGFSIPVPIPRLGISKFRSRNRPRDFPRLNFNSDSGSESRLEPRVSVFRFRDERTGNLWITCFTFCHRPWEKGQRRACFSALVFLLGLDYDGKLKKATRKTAISIPEIRLEISFRPKFASSSSRFFEK